MRKLQTGILAALMLPALALPAFARKPDREVQVTWDKLGKLVKGKEAVVVTTAGESIAGKIRRVSADGLELDHDRTISRADVRGVKLEERHGHWRLGGALIGFFGSAAALGAAGANGENEALGLLILGATVAGYAIGRNADKQALFIEVIP
jgi:hypothetical protein